ncbi:MAG: hypothetical protein OEM24_04930 [Paracoccaceae bacterium]|nr:hypothetical protein [Paracoccaceae bacterium]
MSPFPSVTQDLAELERFISAELPQRLAKDPAIVELRQSAERLALRLSNPVRVAIAGLPGAGKTMLANFLAGQIYAAPRTERGNALPVILRYCEKPETIAGWWSGIEIPYRGIEPQSAAEHGPDYIELRLPNPVLEFISFLDMPGVDEWPGQKEQMRWIGGRADVVLWCTKATDAWADEEWQLWSLMPRRVHARSLLVATQTDLLKSPEALEEVVHRLKHATKDQFAELVTIGTRTALDAAPAGRVLDAGAWEMSGGRAMVGALLSAARAVRRADIAAARELLAEAAEALGLAPPRPGKAKPAPAAETAPEPRPDAGAEDAQDEAAQAVRPGRPSSRIGKFKEAAEKEDQAAQPAETEAPPDAATEEPPVPASGEEPAVPAAAKKQPSAPAAPSPLLALLAERAEKLIAYVESGKGFKDWEFMGQITELGDELSAMTVSSRALKNEAAWVKPQVEDALVALSLLQMEQGDRPCEDSAVVVLQLARDLAWAAASPEAA